MQEVIDDAENSCLEVFSTKTIWNFLAWKLYKKPNECHLNKYEKKGKRKKWLKRTTGRKKGNNMVEYWEEENEK